MVKPSLGYQVGDKVISFDRWSASSSEPYWVIEEDIFKIKEIFFQIKDSSGYRARVLLEPCYPAKFRNGFHGIAVIYDEVMPKLNKTLVKHKMKLWLQK